MTTTRNYLRFLAAAMLCWTTTTQAERIAPERARALAAQYIVPTRQAPLVAKAPRLPVEDTPYYIYEGADGHSFAVVAGDDRLGGVLAYSRTSRLDTTLSNGIRLYLSATAAAYAALPADGSGPAARSLKRANTIGPLMTTQWNQTRPYNNYVPAGSSYTGCVATAVAQMMYHSRWPEQGQGRVEYTFLFDKYNGVEETTLSEDLTGHVYDWNKMVPDYYYGSYNEEQADAVAQLMRDVGYACHMQYGYYASGAFLSDARRALEQNFDYTAALRSRGIEGSRRFYDLVVREIEAGYPVALSGNAGGTDAGHAFVADGVNSDGMVHLNLGWGGMGDYWCVFPPYNYRLNMEAVLARPNREGTAIPIDMQPGAPKLHFNAGGELYVDGMLNEPVASRPDTATVIVNQFVNRGEAFRGDVGIALYDAAGTQVGTFPSIYHRRGGATFLFDRDGQEGTLVADGLNVEPIAVKVSLGNLASGYYTLRPVAARRDSTGAFGAWVPMQAAAQLVVELTSESLRIAEQDGSRRGYQLAAHPHWTTATAPTGTTSTLVVPLRNLTGIAADGTLHVVLTKDDESGAEFEATADFANLPAYYTDDTELALYFSSSQPEGRYRFSAYVVNYGDTLPVKRVLNQEESYLYIGANVPVGIEAVKTGSQERSLTEHNVVYDLQGRRVSKPGRGLYIVNGRKVLLK